MWHLIKSSFFSIGEEIVKSVDEAIERVQLKPENVTNRRISKLLGNQTEKFNNYWRKNKNSRKKIQQIRNAAIVLLVS